MQSQRAVGVSMPATVTTDSVSVSPRSAGSVISDLVCVLYYPILRPLSSIILCCQKKNVVLCCN